MNNRYLMFVGFLMLAVGIAAMVLVWPHKNSYQELSVSPTAAVPVIEPAASTMVNSASLEIAETAVTPEVEISAPVVTPPLAKSITPVPAAIEPLPDTSALVLYVGDGCGHCLKVKEYLKSVASLSGHITMKEVFRDQTNASEMQTKAGECGLATDKIGVPFLFTGDRCLIGDVDVIAYFETIK